VAEKNKFSRKITVLLSTENATVPYMTVSKTQEIGMSDAAPSESVSGTVTIRRPREYLT
jgi:hypothetical protein